MPPARAISNGGQEELIQDPIRRAHRVRGKKVFDYAMVNFNSKFTIYFELKDRWISLNTSDFTIKNVE